MTDPSNEQLGAAVHKEVSGETLPEPGPTEVVEENDDVEIADDQADEPDLDDDDDGDDEEAPEEEADTPDDADDDAGGAE